MLSYFWTAQYYVVASMFVGSLEDALGGADTLASPLLMSDLGI